MKPVFKFNNNEYYHIYNRGVDKRLVFLDKYDYDRFLKSVEHFNSIKPIGSLYELSFGGETAKLHKKLVHIIAYCLNQNHYHLKLQQKSIGCISEFMKRLGGGYTWYFNNKHERSGVLFQGTFKSKHITSNEYLLYLSAYVNLNFKVHKLPLGGETAKYVSSWDEYTRTKNGLCATDIIKEQFQNEKEYIAFANGALKNMLEQKEMKKELEKLLLE